MAVNLDEHLETEVQDSWQTYLSANDALTADDNFSHIFKQVKTEHLVTSADGNFVALECSSWLDLSNETEQQSVHKEEPTWQTDFALIKSSERNTIAKLLPISDMLADQLLQPLLGYCLGQNIDIWRYTICIGAFSRQEMMN